MRVIAPITITDAMLVGSTLVEVPPAPHVIGTAYLEGAICSTGVPGGVITVWKSLKSGNIGHPPATSPEWWLEFCSTYSVYEKDRTYAINDRVIDPVDHFVYESQIDGANKGQSLTVGEAWLKVGSTNKLAAFDQLRNTQSEAPVDFTYSIKLTDRASSIAVVGLDARYVTIQMTVGGAEKYSVTLNLSKRKSRSLTEYFFGGFKSITSVQLFNLPRYRNATIHVTVSKPKGRRAVGGIFIGNAIYIGEVQYGANSDHLNFSNVERDKWGNLTLDPQRSVPDGDLKIWFDKALTSEIYALRDQLSGRPAVWSGLDDYAHDYFEPLFYYGIHKKFGINLEDDDHGVISLQLEEM